MQSQVDQSMDSVQSRLDASRRPYIEILEQPKSKVRFRYECEGRSAGSIMGANSTLECKSYPKIMIRNYVGDAHLVVSCVSKDSPYRSHPHKLVSKDNCTNGIFCATLLEGDMTYSFTNLGIQCMKKKDIQASLQQREKQRVDPFGLGFNNRDNLDLNAVRLCFQAYLPKDKDNVIKLEPVVSDIIYDAKTYSDLTIHTLSHVSAPVVGDMKMIILCDKVNKDDIEVRFYEEQDGVVVWDERVKTLEVHKQYAIVLKTPAYKSFEINDPVHVKIQLVTKKDISEPYNFMLTPLDSGRPIFWRYRKNKAQPLALVNLFQNTMTQFVPGEEKKISQDEQIVSAEPIKEKENDYARVDKSVNINMKPHVTFSQHDTDMETNQVPDVLFDTKEKIDERFEELLNEVSNLKDTLEEKNDFLLIEDSNNAVITLDELDDLNNNVNESSVTIEEVHEFPKEHLGQRTEGYGSYSSLQLAMKNQYFIDRNSGGECYEDVLPPQDIPTPPPEVATPPVKPVALSNVKVVIPPASKVTTPPPRPPSHTKPNLATLQRKSTSDKFDSVSTHDDNIPPLPPKRSRKSGLDKNLPPVPKYKSFFHKLFFKSKSKSKPATPRERSLSIDSRKVGGGGSINDDVMLTEAEHYALYTSVAPHATQSEFDEASFYYSPVEGLATK
ncbi:embryonic polarity protein dorsal-like isoform X2 [Diaphorina citri]|nr:embryonic polarity protein dorsal-like isoform X2 [Diaphorina citri]